MRNNTMKKLLVTTIAMSGFVVGSAFGVISENLATELTIVRNVRNVFAHATANLSFARPEIEAEIRRSNLLRVVNETMADDTKKKARPPI